MAGREKSDRFLELNEKDIKMAINEESDDEIPDDTHPFVDAKELPETTKRQTQWSVSVFKEWLQKRYPGEILEDLTKEILAERLTRFYQELKLDKERDYSRSAHLSIRAGINRYLTSTEVGKTFSILRDPVFRIANKSLKSKIKKLNRVVHHHSRAPMEVHDIKNCYTSRVFGAETPMALLRVNFFNIILFFSITGKHKQRALRKNDFVIQKDSNNVEYVEMAGVEEGPKMIATGSWNCPVQYFKKLLSVLNPNQEILFQRPRKTFKDHYKVWYDNIPLGVNSLATMMKEISTEAGLSRIYTTMNIKATPFRLIEEAGIPVAYAMKNPGNADQSTTDPASNHTYHTPQEPLNASQKTDGTSQKSNQSSSKKPDSIYVLQAYPSSCLAQEPDNVYLLKIPDHALHRSNNIYILQMSDRILQPSVHLLKTSVPNFQVSNGGLQNSNGTLLKPVQTLSHTFQKQDGVVQNIVNTLPKADITMDPSEQTYTFQMPDCTLPEPGCTLQTPDGALQISNHTLQKSEPKSDSQNTANESVCFKNLDAVFRKPRKPKKEEIIRYMYEQNLTEKNE